MFYVYVPTFNYYLNRNRSYKSFEEAVKAAKDTGFDCVIEDGKNRYCALWYCGMGLQKII